MKLIIYRIFYSYILLATRLGGRSLFGKISLYLKLAFSSAYWKFINERDFNFVLIFRNKRFEFLLHDSTDIAALEEIYVDEEYDYKLPFEPSYILDLGANYGDTTMYYHALYPEANILAIEPNEASFKRLKSHFEGNQKIQPIRAALAEKSGEIELYTMPNNNLGHSVIMRSETASAVKVPAITIEDLIHKIPNKKFDLIKFDIEGAETILFSKNDLALYGNAYVGEVHYDLSNLSESEVLQAFGDFSLSFKNLNAGSRVIIYACKKS